MRGAALAWCSALWLTAAASAHVIGARHNVVHVIVDDLRPELTAYGLPNRHTPTIEALAARGTTFDRVLRICKRWPPPPVPGPPRGEA